MDREHITNWLDELDIEAHESDECLDGEILWREKYGCRDKQDVIADFILSHTEELMKENEELKKQLKASRETSAVGIDINCRLMKENARLKALVGEVEKSLLGMDDINAVDITEKSSG